MSKPATTDKTMAVRVTQEMWQRLEAAAERAGHTVSEETRQRLWQSFDRERGSTVAPQAAPAGVLPEQIAALAAEIEVYYGDWRENAFAYEAFRAGLDVILRTYPRPEGDPVPIDNSLGMWLFGDEPDPKEVGRTQAAVALSKVGDPRRNAPPREERGA